MLWGGIKDGGLLSSSSVHHHHHGLNRNDSMNSMDISSLSSDSHSSNESFNSHTGVRRSSQLSDTFPYLDEETQDAVFYQEEDDSTFISVPLLAQKLEKEASNLFTDGLILVGLLETMNKVASQLLELAEREPYGVKGARVILKLKHLNGEEEKVGSFSLDPNTASTFEIVLSLEQTQQFGIRSWLGQMTSGTRKSIKIGSRYSLQKIDLYCSTPQAQSVALFNML